MKVVSKNIFISYRAQDTAGETGRLVDDLKQHFEEKQIFIDIDNLEPGADFAEAIAQSLDACEVMLVIIGPYWLGNREGATPRINDPNDWVRLELSTALKRKIRVVPVLVDGATLPKEEQLPPELHPLLRRQAYEISNKRWQYDTDRLIDFTGTWVEDDPGEKSTFILKQNGNKISVQVQAMGQLLSTGTGEISNKNVELQFNLFGSPTILKATLSANGNRMTGTYIMQASGAAQPITLVRSKNAVNE